MPFSLAILCACAARCGSHILALTLLIFIHAAHRLALSNDNVLLIAKMDCDSFNDLSVACQIMSPSH